MWKYITAGQARDDNIAHAHCTLDIQGYKLSIIVMAFLRQQWLHEGASMPRYTYIACFVV
jgi:hypothetical protein